MKKILTLLFMFLTVSSVKAEDVLQVVPFSTVPGVVEDDWECFSVEMINTQSYTALQFDLYLPEGMTLISDGPMELSADRFPGYTRKGVFYPEHSYECTKMNDGHYFVTIYHTDFAPIEGESGELLTFYYETAKDMLSGYYPIKVTGTVLAVDSHTDTKPEASLSFVKVGEPSPNTILDLENYSIPSFVESALPKQNVVKNGVCSNLVLTDGYDFSVPSTFTATSVTSNVVVPSSLGYKTLVLPYDCAVPAGFEAYEVGSVTDGTLDMVPVNTITANKPVILKNEGTATLSANNVEIVPTKGALIDGVLVGTYEAINAPVGSFVLQNHGGNVAFYHVTEAVQPVVGAFRAYLSTPSNEARIRVVFDGEATGIRQIENGELKVDNYYNLNGQRVSKFAKGIVISNGQKIVK